MMVPWPMMDGAQLVPMQDIGSPQGMQDQHPQQNTQAGGDGSHAAGADAAAGCGGNATTLGAQSNVQMVQMPYMMVSAVQENRRMSYAPMTMGNSESPQQGGPQMTMQGRWPVDEEVYSD